MKACPECGAEMKEKHGIYGNFFSCSTYPKCKATVKADEQLEIVVTLDGEESSFQKWTDAHAAIVTAFEAKDEVDVAIKYGKQTMRSEKRHREMFLEAQCETPTALKLFFGMTASTKD